MPILGSDKWLERVFSAPSNVALAAAYDEWAPTYDADMLSIGYVNPAVVAGLVGRYIRDRAGQIFDAGVGTGILGDVLSILGYRDLSGVDISDGMLAKARARKVYGDLRNRVLGEALDFENGSVVAVVSTGVFTIGHAPPSAFDELVRMTRPGGHLIFTVGTPAWQDGGFKEKIQSLEEAGRIQAVEATNAYRPMPVSPTEAALTTRAFVYRVS